MSAACAFLMPVLINVTTSISLDDKFLDFKKSFTIDKESPYN